MSEFEKRSLGRTARILALPVAIAFSFVFWPLSFATAGSCAAKGSSTGGGAAHGSPQMEESEKSDAQPEPTHPLPNQQNDAPEPHSQESTNGEREASVVATRTLPPPLKALSEAKYLYDCLAGGSCDLTKAFAEVRKDAVSHREDLEWIAINGTPAGKIYAAVLIRHYDMPGADSILKDFKKDHSTMVSLNSLEGSYHYSLAEIATDLLSANSIIRLESDR